MLTSGVVEIRASRLYTTSTRPLTVTASLVREGVKSRLARTVVADSGEGTKRPLDLLVVLDRLRDGDYVVCTVTLRHRIGQKERWSFSLPAPSLLSARAGPVTKWFVLAPHTKGQPASPDDAPEKEPSRLFRLGSSRRSLAPPAVPAPWALLLTLSFRDVEPDARRRLSDCRLPVEVRRKLILNAPILHGDSDVVVALYDMRHQPSPSRMGSLSDGVSVTSAGFVARDAPVYISFEGDASSDDEDADEIVIYDEGHSVSPAAAPDLRFAELTAYQQVLDAYALVANEGTSRLRASEQSLAQQLTLIGLEFMRRAESLACTIVNELAVADHLKLVRPLVGKGSLGGAKFIHNGLFLKLPRAGPPFVTDKACANPLWASKKVAGRELAHMNIIGAYFFKAKARISLPLACVVDYRGHRVLALSELPIGEDTLLLGSSNAGASSKKRLVKVSEPQSFPPPRPPSKNHSP